MILIDQISNIVAEIPNILAYFIPGFLSICTYAFFSSKNFEGQCYFIAWCVTISYVIQAFIGSKLTDPVIRTSLSIIIAILGGYGVAWLVTHKVLAWIVSHISRKSINTNIIKDVFDYELGCILSIYDKDNDKRYIGTLFEIEEKGNDSWISLIDYEIWLKDNKSGEWIIDNFDDGYRSKRSLLIKLEDVKHIEVIYDLNSQIIPDKYFRV